MAQLRYANQSGTVYVYDSVSEWDPVKKQSRSKRKCIGKVDPETGEIIPTSGRRGRRPAEPTAGPADSEAEKENSQSLEMAVLQKRYADLEVSYQKALAQNAELLKENKKMKLLLTRFRKEVSTILGE